MISQAAGVNLALPKFPKAGEDFEEFQLLSRLGKGGTSRVFLARDVSLGGKHVALKVTVDRGDEPKIQGALDHPHIARLFDGGATEDGRPYFVMEFVDGEPITDYCRQREFPLDEKLQLFRDVCSAVQHAHQKLVVHRDLKPSNILVTKEGTPKLLDFGIAKLLASGPGEVVTRTTLYEHLFDEDDSTLSNLLDVHVSNIRKKLGAEFITTRRGHGYCIE